jgi:hypothetical protein
VLLEGLVIGKEMSFGETLKIKRQETSGVATNDDLQNIIITNPKIKLEAVKRTEMSPNEKVNTNVRHTRQGTPTKLEDSIKCNFVEITNHPETNKESIESPTSYT